MYIYVWIYENNIKEIVPCLISKVDDIQIKKNVSLLIFSSTLLSSLSCSPLSILIYFSLLGVILWPLGVVISKCIWVIDLVQSIGQHAFHNSSNAYM